MKNDFVPPKITPLNTTILYAHSYPKPNIKRLSCLIKPPWTINTFLLKYTKFNNCNYYLTNCRRAAASARYFSNEPCPTTPPEVRLDFAISISPATAKIRAFRPDGFMSWNKYRFPSRQSAAMSRKISNDRTGWTCAVVIVRQTIRGSPENRGTLWRRHGRRRHRLGNDRRCVWSIRPRISRTRRCKVRASWVSCGCRGEPTVVWRRKSPRSPCPDGYTRSSCRPSSRAGRRRGTRCRRRRTPPILRLHFSYSRILSVFCWIDSKRQTVCHRDIWIVKRSPVPACVKIVNHVDKGLRHLRFQILYLRLITVLGTQ